MRFLKFFIIFFFICCLSGSASAAITYDSFSNYIQVKDMPYANLTTISAAVNDSARINNTGNGVWELNASLYSYNSTIYINNTECSELRICGVDRNGRSMYGNTINDIYKIHDIKITGWNATTNASEIRTAPTSYNTELYNVDFENVSRISLHENLIGDMYNVTYLNCWGMWLDNLNNETIHDIYVPYGHRAGQTSDAFVIHDTRNMNVWNVSINNVSLMGIEIDNSTDGVYDNLSVVNTGNYLSPSIGSEGLAFTQGQNNTATNLYVDKTGWGALYLSGSENGTTYRNVTVNHSGHNGLDLHPAFNCSVYNITISNSDQYAILLTGGYEYLRGPDNITISGAIVDGAIADIVNCTNITYENIVSTHRGCKLCQMGNNSAYGRIINVTLLEPVAGENYLGVVNIDLSWNLTTNHARVIDSSCVGLQSDNAIDTKIINTNFSEIYSCQDMGIYQYLDIVTVDGSGNRISGTTIDLINEKNASKQSTDRLGTEQTHFCTNNGRTYLPLENYTGTPTILQDYYNVSIASRIGYNHTASISTSHGDVLLSNITATSAWQRSSANVPKYTITAIVNSSSDLHFTGYMPSMNYNNFSSGDIVKFQVWASEPLTNVVWKKDGVELQNSTSTTYTTVLGSAPITVDLTGTSETGTVSKSFVVDPDQTIDPDLDPGVLAPIANFTANVTTGNYPLRVLFNDTSENVPTAWYWDFDNNGIVDSTSQNATYKYKKPGLYTAKLVVSNENNTDFETKTAYINVTGTSPARKPFFSVFGDWLNMFYQLFGE